MPSSPSAHRRGGREYSAGVAWIPGFARFEPSNVACCGIRYAAIGGTDASRQLGHLADNFGGTLALRRAVTFRGWREAIVARGVDQPTRRIECNGGRNGVYLRHSRW